MKKHRQTTVFIILFLAGLAFFAVGMIYRDSVRLDFLIFIPAFLLMEAKFLYEFAHQLFHHGKIGEELLVIGASAITVALGDYIESLSLVVMFLLGEFIIHLIERNNTPPEEGEHCHLTTHEHNHNQNKGVLAFLKYYLIAVAAGIVVVLVLSLFFDLLDFSDMWKTIAILLLIACPCTLFISTPLCKYNAMKRLRAAGIRLDNLEELDDIAKSASLTDAARHMEGVQNPEVCYSIAKKYRNKVIQNIAIIIVAKIVFMVLSLFLHNTIFAVSADLIIAVILFINSYFLGKTK